MADGMSGLVYVLLVALVRFLGAHSKQDSRDRKAPRITSSSLGGDARGTRPGLPSGCPSDASRALREFAQRTSGQASRDAVRYAEMLERAPEERGPAILAALCLEKYPALVRDDSELPRARLLLARRALPLRLQHVHSAYVAPLVLGVPPQELSHGLTRDEARRWLEESLGMMPPVRWLLRQHNVPERIVAHDVAVARWIIAAMRDPVRWQALERVREMRGLFGTVVRGRLIDRIDELTEPDLCASIERTFGNAKKRSYESTLKTISGLRAPLAPAPAWWQAQPFARLLITGAELVAEGREMEHCVPLAAFSVLKRVCVIVALNVHGHRSTVELDPVTVEVRQHLGHRNARPHPQCEALLRQLLPLWRAAFERQRRA